MNTTPKPLIQLNAAESDAWREHNAQLNALKEWARHIKKYAQDHFVEYEDDRRLIMLLHNMLNSKRGKDDHVPEPLVACWINGICVPENYGLHDALMEALGLPKSNGNNNSAVEKRMHATMFYTMIDERFRTNDPESLKPPTAGQKDRVRAGEGPEFYDARERRAYPSHSGKKTSDYYDRAGIPARRKDSPNTYSEINDGMLRKWLGADSETATKNAHEFLSAFLALHNIAKTEAADSIGCSSVFISDICHGNCLPAKDMLSRFKKFMDSYGEQYYPRFEALVITNRLDIVSRIKEDEKADIEKKSGRPYAAEITHVLVDVPSHYWAAVLWRCNHPRARERPLPEGSPPAAVVDHCPLRTRGDYIRALRLALGQRVKDAEAATHVSGQVICNIEHYGARQDEDDKARMRLIEHYQKLDQERVEALRGQGKSPEPYYHPGVYSYLPRCKYTPSRAQHEGRLADAPAQGSGMALGGSPTPPRPALPGAPPAPPADA